MVCWMRSHAGNGVVRAGVVGRILDFGERHLAVWGAQSAHRGIGQAPAAR
jgi:hypothetical protein